jgi:hypothetical protein
MFIPKSWDAVKNFLDKDIRERFEEPIYDTSDKEMRIRAYWVDNAPLVATLLQLSRNITKILPIKGE